LQSAAEAAQLLHSKQPAVVMFYANFCGHCKAMMPDFEQAASEPYEQTGLIIARVEANKLKDMAAVAAQLPKISGFPSMVTNYEGPELKTHVGRKDAAGIKAVLSSAKSMNTVMHPSSGMRASSGSCGGGSSAALAQLAMNHHNNSRAAPMPVPSNERVIQDLSSVQALCDLMQGDQQAIVMAYADWCGHCKAMRADFESLVYKAPTGIVIARINADKLKKMSDCTGPKGTVSAITAYPTILFNDGGNIHTKVGRQTMVQLLDLLGGYDRKVKEYQSFDDLCADLQSDKKVIVMAYADWCGYCKAMMPDIEELAKRAPKGIHVGKINASVINALSICDGPNGAVDVINAYPTVLYNVKGYVDRAVGKQSLEALLKLVGA